MICYEKFHFMCRISSPNATRSLKTHQLYLTNLESKLKTHQLVGEKGHAFKLGREAGRNQYQSEWSNQVAVGKVVMIFAPNKTRPYWQMGKIMELLPGKDGVVRTVKLKRPDNSEGVYTINPLYTLKLDVLPVNVGDVDDMSESADSSCADGGAVAPLRYNLRSSN